MQPEEFQTLYNVPRETLERFKIYENLLHKWQKAINLISPSTLDIIWPRHFTDSAQLSEYISNNIKLADIGSGAGFPGMVLGILRPDLEIHLIESDQRKCEFLRTVSRETDTPIFIHNERAEVVLSTINPQIITARAFANIESIFDLTLSNNIMCDLLLLKGKNYTLEIAQAKKKYDFTVHITASQTDSQAKLLEFKNVRLII